MQHHLGNPAREKHAHRHVVVRPVRKRVDESRGGAVDPAPVVDRRPAQSRRMGDCGNVEQEVRGSSEGRMDDHCVLDRLVGQDSGERAPRVPLVVDGSGGTAGDVEPDRLPRRGERGVRNREPEGLGDDLRGGGGSEELTAATGGRTGAAAEIGGLVERDELVRETRSQRLHGARVLAAPGRQRDPSGDDCSRQVAERGDRHQHGRKALVTGADADHAPAVRQAAHEPAQHERRVVAVGQGVEHAGRALRPAVARVRDVRRERQPAEAVELRRGLANQQSDLPVAGVIAERDGGAVVGANSTECREEEELVASDLRRLPAHTGVLREAEHVAGRALLQERVRERQSPFGPCRGRLDLEEVGAVRRLRHRPLSCSGRTREPSRTWSRSGPAWRRRSGRSSEGRTRRPPSPHRGNVALRP